MKAKDFIEQLKSLGIEFFTGTPDSALKAVTAAMEPNLIATNEGNAIALGVGHHLATGKIPLVYMQNSGLGNAINPLVSLASRRMYQVPLLLLIGWRGEPGKSDEPQHLEQGEMTPRQLELMGIPFEVLDSNAARSKTLIVKSIERAKDENGPVALLVPNGTFDKESFSGERDFETDLSRKKAIERIVKALDSQNTSFVSSTGMISRELYELCFENKPSIFYNVGAMGHTSQIALGIALSSPDRRVVCLDGDGSALMHLGAFATIGSEKPQNFLHIVLNNGAHDSVGGQPTAARSLSLRAIAAQAGYPYALLAKNLSELENHLAQLKDGLTFLEVWVKKGARKDLGRPKTSPLENKSRFMNSL